MEQASAMVAALLGAPLALATWSSFVSVVQAQGDRFVLDQGFLSGWLG